MRYQHRELRPRSEAPSTFGRAWWLAFQGLAALASPGCPGGSGIGAADATAVLTTDNVHAELTLREADRAAEAGQLREAKKAYARFVADFPKDPLLPLAHLGWGKALLAEGAFEAAIGHFDEVMHAKFTPLREQGQLYRGVGHHLAGNQKGAIADLTPLEGRMVEREHTSLLYRTLTAAYRAIDDRVGVIRALDAVSKADAQGGGSDVHRQIETRVAELSADELARAYDVLPTRGPAWAMVATRAAIDAYENGDSDRTKSILANMRERGVTLHDELKTVASRLHDSAQGEPGIIGAIAPLSGPSYILGRQLMQGVLLASGHPTTAATTTTNPRVIFRDSRGDTGRALQALNELAGFHKAIAVVALARGDASHQLAQRAQELGVPIVLLSASTGPINAAAYRLFPSPRGEIRELVRFARKRGNKNFAVLYPDSNYGKAMAALYAKMVQNFGGQTVIQASYAAGSTVFSASIEQLAKTSFDVLFLPTGAETVALLAPALASAGVWSEGSGQPAESLWLVPSAGFNRSLASTTHRYLQGAVFATPFLAEASSAASAFATNYKSRFTAEPDTVAAYAYDAYRLLHTTIEASDVSDRSSLLEQLGRGVRIDSAGASDGVSADHLPRRSSHLVVLRSQTFELLPAD